MNGIANEGPFAHVIGPAVYVKMAHTTNKAPVHPSPQTNGGSVSVTT